MSQELELLKKNKKYKEDSDYNPEFFKDIERRSNILSCIQCGTCTASCQSGLWTALKTRLIVRKVVLGDLSVLEDPDIWLCTTCYQCYERCPRDVRPTDVIMQLRNYATKLGNVNPKHKAVIGYLKNTGHAVPINDKIRAERKALGLDELPPTLYKYKEECDELEKMAKILFNVPEKKKEAKA
ncbi:MAG: CoB--CoM heterodisulfide reductase subunit C [Promethearchaeota archaeon]